MAEDFPFKAEYAKSGRASCKACKSSIAQDSLRLAVMVQDPLETPSKNPTCSPVFDGKIPNWFHYKCFWKRAKVQSPQEIHGFDALRWEDQQKIKVQASGDEGGGDTGDSGGSSGNINDFTTEYAKSGKSTCRGCEDKIPKEEMVQTVMAFDKPSPVKGLILKQNDAKCRVSLWRELMKSDVKTGDFVSITNVVVGSWNRDVSLSTTNTSKLEDDVRISKKDYDSMRAKMYGPVDQWYHVDCFIEKRDELEFGTDMNVEKVKGFSQLKKEDRDELIKKIGKGDSKAGKKRKGENDKGDSGTKKVKREETEEEKQLKEQSQLIWRLRDELKKHVSNEAMKILLELNGQEIPSGESRIKKMNEEEENVTDCIGNCPVWAELKSGVPRNLLWPSLVVKKNETDKANFVYCKSDDLIFEIKSSITMNQENFEFYRRQGSEILLKKKLKKLFLAYTNDCEWAVGILLTSMNIDLYSVNPLRPDPKSKTRSVSTVKRKAPVAAGGPFKLYEPAAESSSVVSFKKAKISAAPVVSLDVFKDEEDELIICQSRDEYHGSFVYKITEKDGSEDKVDDPVSDSEDKFGDIVIDSKDKADGCVSDSEDKLVHSEDKIDDCLSDSKDKLVHSEDKVDDPVSDSEDNFNERVSDSEDKIDDVVIESKDKVDDCVSDSEDKLVHSEDKVDDRAGDYEDKIGDFVIDSKDKGDDCVSDSEDKLEHSKDKVNDCVSDSEYHVSDFEDKVDPVSDSEDKIVYVVIDSKEKVDDRASDCKTKVDDHVSDSEDKGDDCVSDSEDKDDDCVSDSEDKGDDCVSDSEDKGDDCVSDSEDKVDNYASDCDDHVSDSEYCVSDSEYHLSDSEDHVSDSEEHVSDSEEHVSDSEGKVADCFEKMSNNHIGDLEHKVDDHSEKRVNSRVSDSEDTVDDCVSDSDDKVENFVSDSEDKTDGHFENKVDDCVNVSEVKVDNHSEDKVDDHVNKSDDKVDDHFEKKVDDHVSDSEDKVDDHFEKKVDDCVSDSEDKIDGDTTDNKDIKAVTPASHGFDGQRIYDKKHACYFCGVLFSKISEHLENKHVKEIEVSRIIAMKLKSRERKIAWKRIRNMGDFQHNIKVLTKKTETNCIIVERRPKGAKTVDEFLPCNYCVGFFFKRDLWRHSKVCPLKNCKLEQEKEKSVYFSSRLLLESASSSGNDQLDQDFATVTAGMKKDHVLEVVKNDKSLKLLGGTMFKRVGTARIANVRQKLRELGRFIIEYNKKNPMTFDNVLAPKNFDDIAMTVWKIAGSTESCEEGQTHKGIPKYDKPSLALKLGHSLKRLAELKRGTAIRKSDEVGRKEAEDYIILHETEWKDKISSHASQTIAERKFNNPNLLPLTEDVVSLRKYLLNNEQRLGKELRQNPSLSTWRNLAQVILSRVTVFNKRRGGEVGQMFLATYENRIIWGDAANQELKDTLQPIEKKLMERLQLVEIVGKKGRKVPVLLTVDMREAIAVLIDTRKDFVPTENKYLFAAPTTTNGYLKGWDALHFTAHDAKLKKPELITATNMRKYVATVSQIVDLNSNNELEWLANHMGHSLAVHRQYYRLQEQTLELAKVSKLLIATDEGQAHKYAGKSLDDMNLEDIDDVVVVDGEVDTDIQDEVEKTGREAAEFEGTGTEETEFERTGKEAEDLDTDELGEESESPHLKQKLEKRKRQRKTWSNEERTLLAKAFHQNFITGSPPGKKFVMSQGKQYRGVKEMIRNRGWKAIKFYVWNLVQQHNKKKKKLTCQK